MGRSGRCLKSPLPHPRKPFILRKDTVPSRRWHSVDPFPSFPIVHHGGRARGTPMLSGKVGLVWTPASPHLLQARPPTAIVRRGLPSMSLCTQAPKVVEKIVNLFPKWAVSTPHLPEPCPPDMLLSGAPRWGPPHAPIPWYTEDTELPRQLGAQEEDSHRVRSRHLDRWSS